ncbi:MAG TPA: TrbI/VirB10 family protein [Sphingobium sp.]|uniref:TrbI/VirB10 family protein n=1 Tax=Sphingobium sp. TaxID=1912891 RepID=UPI002ED14E5B
MSEGIPTQKSGSEAHTLPKVDPETLAIRARPGRAIRFRRGAIIGIAALGSVSLMGVAWMALKPKVFVKVAQGDDLSEPSKASSDALAKLPTSYAQVPQLGPPLPGDLGRPMLRQQQMAGTGTLPASQVDDVASRRQRAAADLKTARESGLLVQVGARPAAGQQAAATAVTPTVAPEGPTATSAANGDPGGQQHKAAFMAQTDQGGAVNPHSLAKPQSPNMIVAGSVIAASLITGLNSDLPGLVTAQVTQNVYDSATGRTLLVPQGARLLGKYDSLVAFGQKRALVIWQRIILPDGSSLQIDNMPATDPSGYGGLADKVDFHSWALLKGVGIATLLGVGAELQFSGGSDLVQAIRQSTQTNVARAGDQITARGLEIQPSITIRPGAPVRLLVQKDIVLPPWNGGRS